MDKVLVVWFIFSILFIPQAYAQSGQVDGWWTDASGVNHQCPPDCGGSSSTSSGAVDYNALTSAYNVGAAMWQMGQQQAENDAAMLRQQEIQRQEAARRAREEQLRREEQQRQAHAQLMSELSLLDSPGKGGPELLPMDDDAKSKPAGTSFFGLGGDKGSAQGLFEESLGKITSEPPAEFKNLDETWLKEQKAAIARRLQEPNKWCESITEHLKKDEPPLPPKKFSELKPGDVLLVKASGSSWAITGADSLLSLSTKSNASHTVLYLKEVNGKKYFLDNTPGEGPHIISGEEYQAEYGARGAQVASLVQPLNEQEAKKLYAAAVEMAAKNRKNIIGSPLFGTDYGLWFGNNVVCSEADWALLKTVRNIPKTSNWAKRGLGVDFSPLDFFNNEQYFLVTPLGE